MTDNDKPKPPMIRLFRSDDLPPLLVFWEDIYQELGWPVRPEDELEQIKDVFSGKTGFLFVACRDDEILGSGGVKPWHEPGSAILKRFYLADELRGSGLAAEMFEKVVGEAQRMGYHRLVLDVARDNPRALKFYENVGFTRFEPDTLGPWGNVQQEKPELFWFYEKEI
jgi:RimJ/RimL family protein N-acetyltransferase